MSDEIEVQVDTRKPWSIIRKADGEEVNHGTIMAEKAEDAREEFLRRYSDEVEPGADHSEREEMSRGLSVTEAIKSYRKDKWDTKFVVENPNREAREFDMDAPDSMIMVGSYCDWLDEQGCHLEAELMRYEWGMRIGNVPRTKAVMERVAYLRKYLEIPDKRLINEQVDGQRGRKQTITLYLQEPLGAFYTKATANLLHLSNEKFQAVLHANPIMNLCIACNGTAAPALVVKYLNYQWFKKLEVLELNNLEVPFVSLREMFRGSPIRLRELVISGRQKNLPTLQQLQLLPRLVMEFEYLWKIDYHGVKYDYRYEPENQPK